MNEILCVFIIGGMCVLKINNLADKLQKLEISQVAPYRLKKVILVSSILRFRISYLKNRIIKLFYFRMLLVLQFLFCTFLVPRRPKVPIATVPMLVALFSQQKKFRGSLEHQNAKAKDYPMSGPLPEKTEDKQPVPGQILKFLTPRDYGHFPSI